MGMAMDWKEKRLTDIVTFQRGFDLPKKKFKKVIILLLALQE